MEQTEQLMRYGGGGGTLISPLAAVLVAIAIVLMLAAKPRAALLPFLIACFFVPLSQQVVLAGLHFMMFRILVIVGWVRLISSGKLARRARRMRFGAIDRTIVAYGLASAIAFVLLWSAWGAVIERMGFLFNLFGLYFLFRYLIEDQSEAVGVIRGIAVVCIVLSICMVNEKLTGRNAFAVFGGVPEITYIREGKLRAQGAFAHPILAGTFGATAFPLFAGLRSIRRYRTVATLAMAAAVVVTICSASSTPLMALVAGILALCFWPVRRRLALLRWGLIGVVVALHLVMKAPVWALINRVDLVGGSSSSHRYELIDQAIRHFSDWWMVGTRQVSSWGFEMSDTSNQYVDIGVTGGAITLALFIALLAYSFRNIGRGRRECAGTPAEWQVWTLGCSLFANTVAFVGISYFDQIIVSWYALLALIANVRVFVPSRPVRPVIVSSTWQSSPVRIGQRA